jgi:RimJ/RimL family protein N-acetyltransferase
MTSLRLRPVQDRDLDQLFAFERDPAAVRMAAFTRADPSDCQAFDAHYRRVRANPQNTLCAIERDGILVGQIASFTIEDSREISYWIDPARWGRGLLAPLDMFLEIERTRLLHARVAEHNIASARVLTRAGFVKIGWEVSYADGVAHEVVEHIYRRER